MQSRAQQKLRETFGHMTAEEWDIHTYPLSGGRTLRLQIERDIQREDAGVYIRWGKSYTMEKTSEWRSPASTHAKLKVGPEEKCVASTDLTQARTMLETC